MLHIKFKDNLCKRREDQNIKYERMGDEKPKYLNELDRQISVETIQKTVADYYKPALTHVFSKAAATRARTSLSTLSRATATSTTLHCG